MMGSPDMMLLAPTLLHSLWQGAVICALVWLSLTVLNERKTEFRYWVAVSGMFSIFLVAVGTYSWLGYDPEAPIQASTQADSFVSTSTAIPTEPIVDTTTPKSTAPAENIPVYSNLDRESSTSWHEVLCYGWVCGALFMLVRMARDLWATNRFRGACDDVDNDFILSTFRSVAEQVGLQKKIGLLFHRTLPQPATFGVLKPIIVLPVSALTGLSEEQLRAILIHELAHIKRHDYVINIAQRLLEALFFFNPFVWILSRMVRFEREACCDRMAADLLGSGQAYARSLLESIQLFQAAPVGLGNALGADKTTTFAERLRRIVRPKSVFNFKLRWKGLAATVIVIGAIGAGLSITTHKTVIYTAERLTPAERVDKIARLSEEPRFDHRGPLSINGQVFDKDGQPYSGHLNTFIFGPNISMSSSLTAHNGRFRTGKIDSNMLHITFTGAEHGPTTVGPFSGEPGSTIEYVEVRLNPGVQNKVKVVDENGDPISNVKISGGHRFRPNAWATSLRMTTDKNGLFTVYGNPEFAITLQPGREEINYQRITKTFRVKEGASHVWEWKRGIPLTGKVVSTENGRAVSGASIILAHRRMPNAQSQSFGLSNKVAESDDDGAFKVEALMPDSQNNFYVKAAGYQPRLLEAVRETDGPLKIEMLPSLTLTGKIDLPTDQMPEEIKIYTGIEYVAQSLDHHSVTSSVIDGRFEFNDLFAGSWVIGVRDTIPSFPIELTETVSGIVVKGFGPKVPLEIRLVAPGGHPQPHGHIKIRYNYDDPQLHFQGSWDNKDVIPVVDGKSNIKIPPEAKKITIESQQRNGWDGRRLDEKVGLPGFYFEPVTFEKNEAGQFESVLEIPCTPAGSATVHAIPHDGSPFDESGIVHVRIVEEELSRFTYSTSYFRSAIGMGKDGALVSPLPLGKEYWFELKVNGSILLNPAVTLTKQHPMARVEFHLPKPQTLKVIVTDKNGQPFGDASISLYGEYNDERVDLGFYQQTDHRGVVLIPNFYVDPKIDYILYVSGSSRKEIRVKSFRKPIRVRLD